MWDLILICALAFFAYTYVRDARRLPIPPGPRGLPVLGNALQIPREQSWLQFTEWAKRYGPVMHLSVVENPIIILSSREAIIDLLEKKSIMYSDRPVVPMAGQLAGLDRYPALLPYGHRLREGRKLMLGAVNPRKAAELHVIQEAKTAEFVIRLAREPSEFRAHIHWLVTAIALQVTYGLSAGSSDDPFVLSIAKALGDFSDIAAPGAYLVDGLPFLKYVPEWFPGASFKTKAREVGDYNRALEVDLYREAQAQLERGHAAQSFVADFLARNPPPTSMDHELCRQVATQFYGAGSDTTASALLSFFLIMARHPDIQQKAQAEVDAVIGDRPPTFSNRQNMPYVEAVLKEVHRWSPVLPIALPHQVRSEDVYAGYRIPAGSTVLPNTWAVLHDPALYPSPDEVIPERYLNRSDQFLNPDPQDFAFGYGRRVCPGRMLAEDTFFIAATYVLASFDIGEAFPLAGDEIKYTGGVISHAADFTCSITPRISDDKQA
ncbi:cytochrome P450 [Fomitopsis betulina]|nr:cytochrome P450 [Fomitopsis betulina]